jgi:high-affinity Fe2+/Pb2+ permease
MVVRRPSRLATETKHALKTTEFWAYLATVAGILVAAWVVSSGNGKNTGDAFKASQAWLYVAIVSVGYMVSRGLAKAGSREPYWADGDNDSRG